MSKKFYPAVFSEQPEGGYSVSLPDLPGCFGEGDTIEEAYDNVFNAMGLYMQDDKGVFKFPKASHRKDISVKDDEFIVLVGFDVNEYLAKNDATLENMTVKIPRFVKVAGKERGINFSATLTEAVIEKLQG